MSEATRKKASWELDLVSGISTITFPSELTWSLDLTELYPMWGAEFNEIQKKAADYGVRQKLADMTAASKDVSYTDEERRDIMEAGYERLLAGDWNAKVGPREGQLVKQVREATDEQLTTLAGLGLEPLSSLAAKELEKRAGKGE